MKIKYLVVGIFAVGALSMSQAQDQASARIYSNNTTENSESTEELSSVQANLDKNADIQTLRMKEALDLDEEQFYEVREINYGYADDVYDATMQCDNKDLQNELNSIDATRESRLKQALTRKQFKIFKSQKDANGWNYENFRMDCLNNEAAGVVFTNSATTESDYDTTCNDTIYSGKLWVRPEYANMPLPNPGELVPNGCTLSSINATPVDEEYKYKENSRKIELKGNGDKFKEKKNKIKVKTKGEKEKIKTNNPKNPKDLKVTIKDKYNNKAAQ